jgi:hypothetical protein
LSDSENVVLHELDRGPAFGVVRFSISTYRRRCYLDLRLWYRDEESGQLKPTKKGVSIPADCLGDLEAAVDKYRAALRVPA